MATPLVLLKIHWRSHNHYLKVVQGDHNIFDDGHEWSSGMKYIQRPGWLSALSTRILSLHNYEYGQYMTHDMQTNPQNKLYPEILREEAEISRLRILGLWRFDAATYFSLFVNLITLFPCFICNSP